MECKISLGANKFVSIPERFMAGDETTLSFLSSEYDLGELRCTITDGTFSKRHVVKGGKFDISEYCKKAGVLEITVDLILRGTVAKTWLLEPFVVRENGGGYELIPEIFLLRREVRRMKKIIRELNTKINDTM